MHYHRQRNNRFPYQSGFHMGLSRAVQFLFAGQPGTHLWVISFPIHYRGYSLYLYLCLNKPDVFFECCPCFPFLLWKNWIANNCIAVKKKQEVLSILFSLLTLYYLFNKF